ncbi:hypothetical protein N656DRAFT_642396 [Canariomyces notabilis]|uniref:Uncharacterized protein n=1 Tax=Canariomyces notabilis TaxID=2074819 RepID=A0AAN6TEQ9_9PEZI|nr:hypothetical protein N656DRAFT_642396 [Canariomyces arenarius]
MVHGDAEVAQSGLAEAALARVLLRRTPRSVRICLPPLCSASGAAHGKAESRRFHRPVPPRARSASPSQKRRREGHVIFQGPHRPASLSAGLANPVRPSPDPAACGPEIDRSRVRRPTRRLRYQQPACLAAAALAFGPIVAKGGSPICRRRRLNAPSEKRPPGVSAFDAIDTCGLGDMGADPTGERRYPGRQGNGE